MVFRPSASFMSTPFRHNRFIHHRLSGFNRRHAVCSPPPSLKGRSRKEIDAKSPENPALLWGARSADVRSGQGLWAGIIISSESRVPSCKRLLESPSAINTRYSELGTRYSGLGTRYF